MDGMDFDREIAILISSIMKMVWILIKKGEKKMKKDEKRWKKMKKLKHEAQTRNLKHET